MESSSITITLMTLAASPPCVFCLAVMRLAGRSEARRRPRPNEPRPQTRRRCPPADFRLARLCRFGPVIVLEACAIDTCRASWSESAGVVSADQLHAARSRVQTCRRPIAGDSCGVRRRRPGGPRSGWRRAAAEAKGGGGRDEDQARARRLVFSARRELMSSLRVAIDDAVARRHRAARRRRADSVSRSGLAAIAATTSPSPPTSTRPWSTRARPLRRRRARDAHRNPQARAAQERRGRHLRDGAGDRIAIVQNYTLEGAAEPVRLTKRAVWPRRRGRRRPSAPARRRSRTS